MTTMNYRLRSMPSAQAHVEFVYDNHNELVSIRLVSYRTSIIETGRIEKDGEFLWVTNVLFNPAYSRTTMRHVNRFTNELFGCNYYYECKDAWAKNVPLSEVLNTNTIMNFCNKYKQYGKHFNY